MFFPQGKAHSFAWCFPDTQGKRNRIYPPPPIQCPGRSICGDQGHTATVVLHKGCTGGEPISSVWIQLCKEQGARANLVLLGGQEQAHTATCPGARRRALPTSLAVVLGYTSDPCARAHNAVRGDQTAAPRLSVVPLPGQGMHQGHHFHSQLQFLFKFCYQIKQFLVQNFACS